MLVLIRAANRQQLATISKASYLYPDDRSGVIAVSQTLLTRKNRCLSVKIQLHGFS